MLRISSVLETWAEIIGLWFLSEIEKKISEKYGDNFWHELMMKRGSLFHFWNENFSKEWRQPGKVFPRWVKYWSQSLGTQDIMLLNYLPNVAIINAKYYSDLLTNLLRPSWIKPRQGKLHLRSLWQNYNATPRAAYDKNVWEDLKWKIPLQYSFYSFDLKIFVSPN